MELKTFLKAGIHDAIDAVEEVIREREGRPGHLNPKVLNADEFEIDTIEFDLAVTVGSRKEGAAGASLDVVALKVGADGKLAAEHTEFNRMRFTIGVAWPYASITDVKRLRRASTSN